MDLVIRPSSPHRPFRSYGQAGPSTPGLTSRDRRQVRKPGSRHLTPCVSFDPAAGGQGGRSGQRQRGVDLRGDEHLAGQRPIAGQQFFRTPVMLRTSSHSELPRGVGGSVSGVRSIRFRGRITAPDRVATGPPPCSTTRSTETPQRGSARRKPWKSRGSHHQVPLARNGGESMIGFPIGTSRFDPGVFHPRSRHSTSRCAPSRRARRWGSLPWRATPPVGDGLAVAVVIERRTCPCCRGERPDPG